MFNKFLAGNEKAVVGGLSAGVLALLGQVGINSQLTVKETIYAAATWVVTHIAVWISTNSFKVPVPPKSPVAPPVVVAPDTTDVETPVEVPSEPVQS